MNPVVSSSFFRDSELGVISLLVILDSEFGVTSRLGFDGILGVQLCLLGDLCCCMGVPALLALLRAVSISDYATVEGRSILVTSIWLLFF